ncbi:MAG: hypothetical protein LBJ01_08740, partial [Tannerella sp.]|nr:hypothetical protein [Tannerella sp.]
MLYLITPVFPQKPVCLSAIGSHLSAIGSYLLTAQKDCGQLFFFDASFLLMLRNEGWDNRKTGLSQKP